MRTTGGPRKAKQGIKSVALRKLSVEPKKVTIVIPAYNEQERIRSAASALLSSSLLREAGKFVFVVDGSDRTAEVLGEMERESGADITVMEYGERLGKGGAVGEGLAAAETEYAGFIDVDGALGVGDIEGIVKELLGKKLDCVIGSRKSFKGRSPLRGICSRGFNLLVRAMFGLGMGDTQCGCKFFRRALAGPPRKPFFRTSGFAFDVELLMRIRENGGKITEYPIENAEDAGGSFSLTESPGMLWELLRLRFS